MSIFTAVVLATAIVIRTSSKDSSNVHIRWCLGCDSTVVEKEMLAEGNNVPTALSFLCSDSLRRGALVLRNYERHEKRAPLKHPVSWKCWKC